MRELVWMWHAKRVHEWDQTGELVSILCNANRGKRRRPYSKSECVPKDLAKEFRVPVGIRLTRRSLHSLKALFENQEN